MTDGLPVDYFNNRIPPVYCISHSAKVLFVEAL